MAEPKRKRLIIEHRAGMRKDRDPMSSEEKEVVGGIVGFLLAILVLGLTVVVTLIVVAG